MRLATLLLTSSMAFSAVSAHGVECPGSKEPDLAFLARADASALVFRIRIVSAHPAAGSHVVLLRVVITQAVKGQSVFYTQDGCLGECHFNVVLVLEVPPEERPSYLQVLPDTEHIVFMPTAPRYLLNYARVEPSYLLPTSPMTDAAITSIDRLLERFEDPHCR